MVLPPLGVLWLRHDPQAHLPDAGERPERLLLALTRRSRAQNSSEARRPRARMHARVGVADEREQLEQALAHRRRARPTAAPRTGRAGARTRRRRGRRRGRGRRPRTARRRPCGCGGRGCARVLQVDALHAIEQAHLAETGAGVVVARVLREGLLVGGDRARRSRPPRSRRTPRRAAAAAAARRARHPSAPSSCGRRRSIPVTPFWAASCSSWAKTSRTCCSGTAPVNSGTGWPATSATTIGIDCARNACESCGLASTSTFASTRRPPSSVTTLSRMGLSCLHGPHHSAHRSMTTGTVRESSSTCGNVSSVTSITSDGRPPAAASARRRPAAAAGRLRSADRSTAPRSAAPGVTSVNLITFASRISEA